MKKNVKFQTMELFKTYKNLLPLLISYDNLIAYGLNKSNAVKNYLLYFYIQLNTCLMVAWLACSVVSLVIMVNTLQEYVDNITIIAAISNDLFILITLRWRFKRVLEIVERIDIIIAKRKCHIHID